MKKREIKKEVLSFLEDNIGIFKKEWDYYTLIDGREVGYLITEIAEYFSEDDEDEQEKIENYICNNIDDWINLIKK